MCRKSDNSDRGPGGVQPWLPRGCGAAAVSAPVASSVFPWLLFLAILCGRCWPVVVYRRPAAAASVLPARSPARRLLLVFCRGRPVAAAGCAALWPWWRPAVAAACLWCRCRCRSCSLRWLQSLTILCCRCWPVFVYRRRPAVLRPAVFYRRRSAAAASGLPTLSPACRLLLVSVGVVPWLLVLAVLRCRRPSSIGIVFCRLLPVQVLGRLPSPHLRWQPALLRGSGGTVLGWALALGNPTAHAAVPLTGTVAGARPSGGAAIGLGRQPMVLVLGHP